MLIVVAITGIITAITIPWFAGVQRQNQVATVTRKIVGYLSSARVYAATGRQFLDGGGIPVQTNQSFVRIQSATRFEIFVQDRNANTLSLEVVDLDVLDPGNQTRITAPSYPFDVRFFIDGSSTAANLTISDLGLGIDRRIQVTGVGMIKVL